jgi:hypothetical protein
MRSAFMLDHPVFVNQLVRTIRITAEAHGGAAPPISVARRLRAGAANGRPRAGVARCRCDVVAAVRGRATSPARYQRRRHYLAAVRNAEAPRWRKISVGVDRLSTLQADTFIGKLFQQLRNTHHGYELDHQSQLDLLNMHSGHISEAFPELARLFMLAIAAEPDVALAGDWF